LPAPDGAEMRISSGGSEGFCDGRAGGRQMIFSFHVLRLFAKPFQFRLECHHLARDGRVVRFGADRIDFAIHFLRQKIQRAPTGSLDLQQSANCKK